MIGIDQCNFKLVLFYLDPTDRFCFEGFPPRTQGAREKWFKDLAQEERTIIFFEAPHRIVESLTDAVTGFGLDRNGAICREMSKHYEEVARGNLGELIEWAKSKDILGELTIVIEGFDPGSREFDQADLIQMVLNLEANGEGPAMLARVCAKFKIKFMTFSSDLVFDGFKKTPYIEFYYFQKRI